MIGTDLVIALVYIIAEVLKSVSIQGKYIEDAIDAVMTGISMNIDQAAWAGVIWTPTRQLIISNKSLERSLSTSID